MKGWAGQALLVAALFSTLMASTVYAATPYVPGAEKAVWSPGVGYVACYRGVLYISSTPWGPWEQVARLACSNLRLAVVNDTVYAEHSGAIYRVAREGLVKVGTGSLAPGPLGAVAVNGTVLAWWGKARLPGNATLVASPAPGALVVGTGGKLYLYSGGELAPALSAGPWFVLLADGSLLLYNGKGEALALKVPSLGGAPILADAFSDPRGGYSACIVGPDGLAVLTSEGARIYRGVRPSVVFATLAGGSPGCLAPEGVLYTAKGPLRLQGTVYWRGDAAYVTSAKGPGLLVTRRGLYRFPFMPVIAAETGNGILGHSMHGKLLAEINGSVYSILISLPLPWGGGYYATVIRGTGNSIDAGVVLHNDTRTLYLATGNATAAVPGAQTLLVYGNERLFLVRALGGTGLEVTEWPVQVKRPIAAFPLPGGAAVYSANETQICASGGKVVIIRGEADGMLAGSTVIYWNTGIALINALTAEDAKAIINTTLLINGSVAATGLIFPASKQVPQAATCREGILVYMPGSETYYIIREGRVERRHANLPVYTVEPGTCRILSLTPDGSVVSPGGEIMGKAAKIPMQLVGATIDLASALGIFQVYNGIALQTRILPQTGLNPGAAGMAYTPTKKYGLGILPDLRRYTLIDLRLGGQELAIGTNIAATAAAVLYNTTYANIRMPPGSSLAPAGLFRSEKLFLVDTLTGEVAGVSLEKAYKKIILGIKDTKQGKKEAKTETATTATQQSPIATQPNQQATTTVAAANTKTASTQTAITTTTTTHSRHSTSTYRKNSEITSHKHTAHASATNSKLSGERATVTGNSSRTSNVSTSLPTSALLGIVAASVMILLLAGGRKRRQGGRI